MNSIVPVNSVFCLLHGEPVRCYCSHTGKKKKKNASFNRKCVSKPLL